ncbi:AAA family ATPase [Rossellomorea marisflavi]|uniref:AAA family ATPase n=1 Tax=Rossellomorea marisflavi TaxID=189381 RepID=UPI002799EC99|nr:AAA family ATPase [Rossellomorea marisflavi]UTE71910.1 AAA family ATPase [Rossellomorea marisflavi]
MLTIPKRIHIIGSVGSGKTTLARTLSAATGTPYHELDNVVWERQENGDRRRTDQERDAVLADLVKGESWIIEGVHSTAWVEESFRNADVILFLDTPYYKRMKQITFRFIRQKTGRESAHYTPDFTIFRKMFRWNALFERETKPYILKLFRDRDYPHIVLHDNQQPIDWDLRKEKRHV